MVLAQRTNDGRVNDRSLVGRHSSLTTHVGKIADLGLGPCLGLRYAYNGGSLIRNVQTLYPQHAILIPGKLGCAEKLSAELASLSEKAIFFIVTDKQYGPDINMVKWINTPNIVYTEDILDFDDNAKGIRSSLIQWLRYKHAIDALYSWERKHNHRFQFIHKVRTDAIYNRLIDIVSLENENQMNNMDALLCCWDIYFSGRREFMCPLRGVIEFAQSLPDIDVQYIIPENHEQLSESHPIPPFAGYTLPESAACMKDKSSYLAFVNSTLSPTDGLSGDYNWPEHFFGRFANFAGIRIRNWPSTIYHGRLSPWRLANRKWKDDLITNIEAGNVDILLTPDIPLRELEGKGGWINYFHESSTYRGGDKTLLSAALKIAYPGRLKDHIQRDLDSLNNQ